MSNFQVGDRATFKNTPFTVTVTEVSVCEDENCCREVIAFVDPETGEEDTAHAEEFLRS